YHLSFNIGFPNKFDRSHGRTGSHLMVHGDCSSRGCYAMEDAQIQEIYALAREAFRGGQQAFQIQAFPFRMTPENMAKHADSEHFAFWEMLKKGSDHFEVTRKAPRVDVCGRKYVFNASADGGFSPSGACPAYDVQDGVEQLVASKQQTDLERRQSLIARAAAKEQRQDRWEEREKAIASFFDRSRSGEAEASEETPTVAAVAVPAAAAVGAASYSASVPVPRRSPRAGTAVASAQKPRRGGLRLPNPFARRDQAVASTAGVAQPAAPAPVAVQQPARVATTAPQPQPQSDAVAPPQALGYAPAEKNDGFLSGVARGSVGLFKRAGSIFN
ncbi:MAG: transcriptional regulator, partial [Pseudomonadota bacterium]